MLQKAHRKLAILARAVLMPALVPLACAPAGGGETLTLRLELEAFSEGGAIPRKYTCEGEDISPPLAWAGIPDRAKSLVLIADDPDAPDRRRPR